jgi:hypothetical protein
MGYKYLEIKNKRKEVIWVKLVRPYEGNSGYSFPKDMEVEDKTWVYKEDLYLNYQDRGKIKNYVLIENNRYGVNFELEYFEIIDPNQKSEPQYEIY